AEVRARSADRADDVAVSGHAPAAPAVGGPGVPACVLRTANRIAPGARARGRHRAGALPAGRRDDAARASDVADVRAPRARAVAPGRAARAARGGARPDLPFDRRRAAALAPNGEGLGVHRA